jgi:hypothetical protein
LALRVASGHCLKSYPSPCTLSHFFSELLIAWGSAYARLVSAVQVVPVASHVWPRYGTSRNIAGMTFVKITTEQVVAEDDAEAVTELMNVAVAGVAELLTVYDSVVASVNTTEPENAAEIARP